MCDPISPAVGCYVQVSPDVADPGDGTLLFGYNWQSFVVVAVTQSSVVLSFRDVDGVDMYSTTLS